MNRRYTVTADDTEYGIAEYNDIVQIESWEESQDHIKCTLTDDHRVMILRKKDIIKIVPQ